MYSSPSLTQLLILSFAAIDLNIPIQMHITQLILFQSLRSVVFHLNMLNVYFVGRCVIVAVIFWRYAADWNHICTLNSVAMARAHHLNSIS